MENIKQSRIDLIGSCYNECIAYSPVSVTFSGQTIEIVGRGTLQNLNLALIAMQTEGRETTRIRDKNNVCYTVSENDIKSIIAQGAVWGNTQWNKKVDLQNQIAAITLESHGSEAAAISAINAVTW